MQIVTNNDGWKFSNMEDKIDGVNKGLMIIDLINQPQPLIKTASSGPENILKKVAEALASMGIKANIDIGELLKRLSEDSMTKLAAENKTTETTEETVKIASKRVEESHYFIDVSKDTVKKSGKSLILVSAFMREGYLGRYLIKRNFYFLPDNDKEATVTYSNLVSRANRIKRRYYDEKIEVSDIFPELKAFLDGEKGDLEFSKEDRAGTTVYRQKETGHDLTGIASRRHS